MDESNEISNVEDEDNEYDLSGDEEQQSLNDLLTNEIIPFNEIKGLYERVQKPKAVLRTPTLDSILISYLLSCPILI